MNEVALFVEGIFLKIPAYLAISDAIERLFCKPLVNWVGGHIHFCSERKGDAVISGTKRLDFVICTRLLPTKIIGGKAHYR